MGMLIDEALYECSTRSLKWFNVLPNQMIIAKSMLEEYLPIASLSHDSALVEFYVSAEVN